MAKKHENNTDEPTPGVFQSPAGKPLPSKVSSKEEPKKEEPKKEEPRKEEPKKEEPKKEEPKAEVKPKGSASAKPELSERTKAEMAAGAAAVKESEEKLAKAKTEKDKNNKK